MFKNLTDRQLLWATALIGALLFLPFLGRVHLFDWDEINFAEAAREMLVTGNYMRVQIDFAPFWEKPPLFIWCQALSMHIFGVNEFAARLPNALAGIATLVLLVRLGTAVGGRSFGVLWAVVYAGSLLPHFYFRSGIIDPVFNLFIFLGVYFLSQAYVQPAADTANRNSARLKQVVYAGICIGIAVLVKGPVALLLPGLCWAVYWLINWKTVRFPLVAGIVWVVVSILVTSVWYGYDLVVHGSWFLSEFIDYQIRLFTTAKEAGHTGPFYYHFVVLFIGCFPATVFIWPALVQKKNNYTSPALGMLRIWLLLLLCVTLIIFSISKEKIIHYSSLCYFPITFLAAFSVQKLLESKRSPRGYMSYILLVLGSLWAFLLLALPFVGLHTDQIIPLLKDPFAQANLQADVTWTGMELLIGLFYLTVVLYSFWALSKAETVWRGVAAMFIGTTVMICVLLPWVVPKVEGYSQRAAIEFYQSLRGCDCYVMPLDYKSYAHYFYADRQPRYSPGGAGQKPDDFVEWLLAGDIDKPAYFITKVDRAERFLHMPNLKETGRKNGFIFFKREPPVSKP